MFYPMNSQQCQILNYVNLFASNLYYNLIKETLNRAQQLKQLSKIRFYINHFQSKMENSCKTLCWLQYIHNNIEAQKCSSTVEKQSFPQILIQRYFIDKFRNFAKFKSYLIENLPRLIPPLPENQKEEILSNNQMAYNCLYEFWNDYLVQCYLKQMVACFQDQLYIFVPFGNSLVNGLINYLELFQKLQIKQQFSIKEQLSQIFSIPLIQSNKKIGLYLTHPVSKGDNYFPRVNKSAIYVGTYFNNEKWQIFDIPNGKIPQIQQLLTLDSIIITGSSQSVLQQTDYVKLALQRLITAYKQSKTMKIVGFCYGHQLISQRFGSLVVKKQLKSGLETVRFNNSTIQKYPFLSALKDEPKPLHLYQYHQDYVETLPQGFQLLAQSDSCKIQGLVCKDGRILTFQFHSQYIFEYIKEVYYILKRNGIDKGYKIDQNIEQVEQNSKDSSRFNKIIQQYIDS